jgi:parallel beta-helix repeat protein
MPNRSRRQFLLWGALSLGVLALVVVLTMATTPAGNPAWRSANGGGGTPAADLPLAGTDYPVPPGAILVSPTGKDGAPGTADQPLRSVAAAIALVAPGGTVVLRGGTYRETVGLVKKRITLQPYPGEHVWLKGSLVVTSWARADKAWRHDGWTTDLCQNCFTPEIIDPEHSLAGSPDMAFVNGKALRQVGSTGEVGPGTFFVDRAAKALFVGDDPNGKLVEATVFDRFLQFDTNSGGSVLRGIGVAQYGSNQDYGKRGAMVVVNAPDVTIENATFAWSASSGLAVFQPGGKVTGGAFRNNGLVGLVANRADDLRLTGNSFTANNQERFSLSGEAIGAGGAKLTRTKRPYVADNSFADNIGNGWWCDLGCTDATVIRNVARGNAVNGLYYEVSSRALIASNTMTGNAARGLKISSSDHVRVYQNTFAGNGTTLGLYNDKRGPESDPYSKQLGISWRTDNVTLVNNLYAGTDATRPIVESADYKASPAANPAFVSSSDGNAYFRSTQGNKAPLVIWVRGAGQSTEYGSLAEFSQGTGSDTRSLALDASPFTDPVNGDYTLRPGSPCLKAGRPLPADIATALGLPPTATPDIGALKKP